jgi:hypothetical protein
MKLTTMMSCTTVSHLSTRWDDFVIKLGSASFHSGSAKKHGWLFSTDSEIYHFPCQLSALLVTIWNDSRSDQRMLREDSSQTLWTIFPDL